MLFTKQIRRWSVAHKFVQFALKSGFLRQDPDGAELKK